MFSVGDRLLIALFVGEVLSRFSLIMKIRKALNSTYVENTGDATEIK